MTDTAILVAIAIVWFTLYFTTLIRFDEHYNRRRKNMKRGKRRKKGD